MLVTRQTREPANLVKTCSEDHSRRSGMPRRAREDSLRFSMVVSLPGALGSCRPCEVANAPLRTFPAELWELRHSYTLSAKPQFSVLIKTSEFVAQEHHLLQIYHAYCRHCCHHCLISL